MSVYQAYNKDVNNDRYIASLIAAFVRLQCIAYCVHIFI